MLPQTCCLASDCIQVSLNTGWGRDRNLGRARKAPDTHSRIEQDRNCQMNLAQESQGMVAPSTAELRPSR